MHVKGKPATVEKMANLSMSCPTTPGGVGSLVGALLLDENINNNA